MSVDLVLLSPLPPRTLAAIESRCSEYLAQWAEAHDDAMEDWGPWGLGGEIPTAEVARGLVCIDGEPAPPDHPKVEMVLERLAAVRSAITIERPGEWARNPLQVSVVSFLIQNMGPGLVLMADKLELGEDVLLQLSQNAGAPGFGDEPASLPRGLAAALLGDGDDDDDDDDDESEAEDAPGLVAARSFVRELTAAEQLLLAEDASERKLGERLLVFFEKMDVTRIGRTVSDWLLEQPEVDELFADDQAIEEALRRNFSR